MLMNINKTWLSCTTGPSSVTTGKEGRTRAMASVNLENELNGRSQMQRDRYGLIPLNGIWTRSTSLETENKWLVARGRGGRRRRGLLGLM